MKKILCFFSLFAILALAGQAMAYNVSLATNPQNILPGDSTTVDVNLALTGTEVLNGFDLKLAFNPAVLGFVTGSLGPQLLADYVGGFTYEPTVDPSLVSFSGFYALDPLITPPTLTGNFTLASLFFTGIGVGASPLNLTGTLDLGNVGLDAVAVTGSVGVVPEPGTVMLLGMGLAGLFGLRKKFMNA